MSSSHPIILVNIRLIVSENASLFLKIKSGIIVILRGCKDTRLALCFADLKEIHMSNKNHHKLLWKVAVTRCQIITSHYPVYLLSLFSLRSKIEIKLTSLYRPYYSQVNSSVNLHRVHILSDSYCSRWFKPVPWTNGQGGLCWFSFLKP